MRFFLGLTQSDIAERVGISQMHVSRLIRQSIDQVRDRLDRESAQPPERERAGCRSDGRRRAGQRRGRAKRSSPRAASL
jgi:RNA polymerase sigma-B factor